jgi:hypothetical protein
MSGKNENINIVIIKQNSDRDISISDLTPHNDVRPPIKKIREKLCPDKKNYILIHFKGCNTVDDFLEKIINLKVDINRFQNKPFVIYIFPFSSDCIPKTEKYCKAARNLRDLLVSIKSKMEITHKKLDELAEIWEKEGKKAVEKKQINDLIIEVLPFCLCCESVYKGGLFEERKEKLREYLKEIRDKIKGSPCKDVVECKKKKNGPDEGWYVRFPAFKDTWETLRNLVKEEDELDDDALKEFIGIKEGMEKISIEKTEWLTLLGDLKQWAANADGQK